MYCLSAIAMALFHKPNNLKSVPLQVKTPLTTK